MGLPACHRTAPGAGEWDDEQVSSDFRLPGDGKHDDTAAIQRLIDAGYALGDLPPGTYRTSATLYLPPPGTPKSPGPTAR